MIDALTHQLIVCTCCLGKGIVVTELLGRGAFRSEVVLVLHNDGIAVGTSDFLTGKVEHDAWARGDVSGPQFHVLAANKELTVDGRRDARKLRQF